VLTRLATDEAEKYKTVWREFGAVLKEGLGEDRGNRDKILPLLRFASTREEGNEPSVSLKQYVERMQAGQERIYYVIADSIEAARASPYIELLKERNIEVLLLADRIDEWVMGQVDEFEGKRFKDAARGDLELGSLAGAADKAAQEELHKESKGLLKRVLCNPVLVYIGTISYTIYLVHLSFLYVLWEHTHLGRASTAALGLAITLAYASVSWFLLERPLIHGARKSKAQAHGHAAASAPASTGRAS